MLSLVLKTGIVLILKSTLKRSADCPSSYIIIIRKGIRPKQ